MIADLEIVNFASLLDGHVDMSFGKVDQCSEVVVKVKFDFTLSPD